MIPPNSGDNHLPNNVIYGIWENHSEVISSLWYFKSPATGPFVQQVVQANKENIETSSYSSICVCEGNSQVTGRFPT